VVDQQRATLQALGQVSERISDLPTNGNPEERQWALRALESRVQVGRELVSVSVGLPPVLVDSVNSTRLLRCTTSWPYWNPKIP
jgi:hypothetical protein